jgi:hypothetical protein
MHLPHMVVVAKEKKRNFLETCILVSERKPLPDLFEMVRSFAE